MGAVFSNSSGGSSSSSKRNEAKASISQVDRAMLDLKNARDRLSKYKRRLEQDDAKLVAKAKQSKQAGQTKTALSLLKLRKIKQREVETTEGQLLTVMQMVQTVDSKQNDAQMLNAMKKGKDALQKMHEDVTVDDVLTLMDDIEEAAQVEKEISDALQGVPSLSVADEAAVEAELEALMMGEVGSLPEAPTTQPLPVAPTTALPDKTPATASSQPEKKVALAS